MLNNITYTISCSELFSVVASSTEQYAVLTMTGHLYGYASASVVVLQHTDDPYIHNEILRLDDLTKDQITHLLSLDCPDAFIAYALTLCPCPPETSDTALSSTDDVDGGILVITKRLKEIKEEINLLNGTAFQNATLTDAQHYQLLDVEMFIDDFIAPYSYREVL